MNVLQALTATLKERQQDAYDEAQTKSSYVASLYAAGTNKILEKVGEEATEVILAAKDLETNATDENRHALANEVADLWFHNMVMLTHLNMSADDVIAALEARLGTSGHTEKANRGTDHIPD